MVGGLIVIKNYVRIFRDRTVIVGFILFLLILFFGVTTPRNIFVSWPSISNLLKVTPQFAIMTIGLGVVLISGEIDLSLGSIYVFCSVIFASLYSHFGINILLAMPLTLLIGSGMGFLNGVLVTKTKMASFIVTLGTMWIYRGTMLVLFGGYAIRVRPEGIEKVFLDMFVGTTTLGDIPIQFLWLIIIGVIIEILIHSTSFGNWVFSVGSNVQAAKMMGINTDMVKTLCYTLSGCLCGFAGFLQVSRIGQAIPQTGEMTMLVAIAGAIIGGISLKGGKGTIIGSLLGGAIIQVISLGLVMLGVIEYYTNIMMGIALIFAAYAFLRLDNIK